MARTARTRAFRSRHRNDLAVSNSGRRCPTTLADQACCGDRRRSSGYDCPAASQEPEFQWLNSGQALRMHERQPKPSYVLETWLIVRFRTITHRRSPKRKFQKEFTPMSGCPASTCVLARHSNALMLALV